MAGFFVGFDIKRAGGERRYAMANQLRATLFWLLEPDSSGVRYLALQDLLDLPPDDPELGAARKVAHTEGYIVAILAEMAEEGYWSEPGPGYNPKYWSTVWSMILLAQLGASVKEDERIAQACAYVLDHTLTSGGQFSTSGAPSGTVDCLQGNLCWALLELGCDDPRLATAFEWMARSVTGDGVAPLEDRQAKVRYYAGKYGPTFACGANNKLPCAWGGSQGDAGVQQVACGPADTRDSGGDQARGRLPVQH
jgi:hypothetical protein